MLSKSNELEARFRHRLAFLLLDAMVALEREHNARTNRLRRCKLSLCGLRPFTGAQLEGDAEGDVEYEAVEMSSL